MNLSFGGVTRQDLHDYVDGRLDPASRARIAHYLATHPDAAAAVESYRAQNAALRVLYDDVLDEPVPAQMRALLRWHPRAAKGHPLALAVAIFLVVLASGAAGWWFRGAYMGDAPVLSHFIAHAEQAYHLARQGAAGASDAAALSGAAPAVVASRRLGVAVTLPDLANAGLMFAGMRFVADRDSEAAVITYRDAYGRPALLLVERLNVDDVPPRLTGDGKVTTLYRVRDGVGYALTLAPGMIDDRLRSALGGNAT
jgi:anti-sigma factor RsiW